MVNDKIDVEKAILKLRETISNINKEGREKINKCFDSVNQNFKNLFTQFFDGGKAFLKMVGSSDPLLSGLEVFASPPGKKMNTLSLLSGGEKTMAATALILAVFLQNPSPICVLDEVDAPLDDINIEKFCRVIKKINYDTSTKFVIITHNPITMAHMDRLYGVTMAETGISKLISIKLEEAQKLREVS
jgi:chromosome segregation protein